MSFATDTIMERHLKKIYDYLNNGCNKKAVQDIDRLPKNLRDMTVFKAVKSLALIRMYKRQQAYEILNEIDPEDDLDEVTLQTMTSCYKESGLNVGRIVGLYEAASRRKPNDQEIMAHLFMAHVRIFNFKRQKEIALQMYRSFHNKKRLYSFWAIMSLVMQSQEEKRSGFPEAPDKQVCLSLAEKMCEKMIDDERNNEEIELYLMILRKQNKHEEEYRFLTGPICLRIIDHLSWFDRRRANLCLDLKMYSRAFKHYFPTLIQKYPDQIEYYQGLFKAAFLLDTEALSQQQPVAINEQQQLQSQASNSPSQSSGTPVKSTSALAECFDIVEKQCLLTLETTDPSSKDNQYHKGKNQAGSKNLSRTSSSNPSRRRLLRGPFMARIELFNIILSNENSIPNNVFNLCKNQFASKCSTLNSLLLDYFQSFSRKIICYYDMDCMIKQLKLTAGDKELFVETVGDWVRSLKQNQPDIGAYDAFHVMLNYQMLNHSLRNYTSSDSKEDRLKLAKKFIDLYDENRHLGKQSSKTEFLPVDNYALLAINSIMTNAVSLDNFTDQSILSDSIIISLIVLAENALTNSPSNHQLKLALLKLYGFIGASKICSEVLFLIDIKHFQIDTLGHLLNPVLYNTGNYSLSRESLETCLEFYAHGLRECFDGLTTSYRDGRFSKIEEISNVLKRLCNSLNLTQCVLLKGVVFNLKADTIAELTAASASFDPSKGLHRMFRIEPEADKLRDNRDFKVLKSLHAETADLLQKRKIETFNDENLWMKLRYYLLKSAYNQLDYFSNKSSQKSNNVDEDGRDPLKELEEAREVVENLKYLISITLDENSGDRLTDNRFSYLEPESSPLRWKHINFQSLVDLVTPLVFLHESGQLDSKLQEHYNKNLNIIISELDKQLSSINSLVKMKRALMSLTISVEFISLAITSLVSLALAVTTSKVAATSTNNSNHLTGSGNSQKAPSSQQQQSAPVKLKTIPQQLMNKTEAQLTRLSILIKNVDPKNLMLDKVSDLEMDLLSKQEYGQLDTKDGSILRPLMSQDSAFQKVKEKLAYSFTESLKEIESTCRRKIRLLR